MRMHIDVNVLQNKQYNSKTKKGNNANRRKAPSMILIFRNPSEGMVIQNLHRGHSILYQL